MLQFLLFCLGCTFLALGIGLYPTEEQKMQSYLEDLWLVACELRRRSYGWVGSLTAAAAKGVGQLLNQTFGSKTLSFRAFTASLCLSGISLAYDFSLSIGTLSLRHLVYLAALVLILLFALRSQLFKLGCLASVLLAVGAVVVLHPTMPFLIVSLVISVVSFIAAIHLLRRYLRIAELHPTAWNSAKLFIVSTLIAVVSLVSPFILAFNVGTAWGELAFYSIANAGIANFGLAVIALLAALTVIALLVHRITWPLGERLLYSLQRIGVFEHRRVLAAIGIGLLGLSWPSADLLISWIEKLK